MIISANPLPGEPGIARVLGRLRDAKQVSNGWQARCPAHNDQQPSLSISQGEDGRVLIHCHAGCSVEEVCQSVGLSLLELFLAECPASLSSSSGGQRRVVATYNYCDEAGTVLFQVVRVEPKSFFQQRPDGKRGWSRTVKGVRVVPYRLPELLADTESPVVIAEGEKDCDALARLDILATTNSGGASKWKAEHSEFLAGRNVIVLPDNDDAGRKHAEMVAKSLYGIAESVRIVELPGLPIKGDASDWIASGGTKELLEQLADAVPLWAPPVLPKPGPVLTCMADVEPRDVAWLWAGRIPLGRITLLVGRPGEGKSFLTTELAAHVTRGTPWTDGSDCPQGSVIFISAEDDPADTIRPRLDAHQADVRLVHLLSAVRKVESDRPYERMVTLADVDAIEASLIKQPNCKLIIVDPIGSFLGGGIDAHRDNEVRGVLAPISRLAEKYGPAVFVVAHRRKGSGSFADDLALGSRAFTGIARAVWHLTRDAEDKDCRLLLPGKNNLSLEGDGLAFLIKGEPARIIWEADPVAMSADDALAKENQPSERKSGPEAKALKAAYDWLEKRLANGPRLMKELLDEWKNEKDGSERTLRRGKEALGIDTYRREVPGPWWWRLTAKDAKATKDEKLGHLGTLGQTSANSADCNPIDSKDAKLPVLGNLVVEHERAPP
jgi:putative DNA primase/helicase